MQTATAYWQTRAETFGAGWCEHYWEAWQQPHRHQLLRCIEMFDGRVSGGTELAVGSVLEVGCGPGANLRAWRQAHPTWVLLGVDVNRAAVQFVNKQFADDRDVLVFHEDFLGTGFLPMADVVVSCYSLAYADPGQLEAVVAKCWRAARRGVVLAEPMAFPGQAVGPCATDIEEWRHDYVDVLQRLGARVTQMFGVEPPADRLNGILVAHKEG